jgi:rubrerythrin
MSNPINSDYPVTDVESVETLMDIAATVEAEAARRFEDLAQQMDRHGNADMAALFRDLAEDEINHGEQIADWASRENRRRPRSTTFSWRMPEAFDLAEAGSGRVITPYEALSVAVRNEERAFAFYSYLAAIAEQATVREHAEGLAKGELEHISRLRSRRRAAYHAENRAATRLPKVDSLEELYPIALGLERASEKLNAELAEALERGGDIASATLLRRVVSEQSAHADSLPSRIEDTAHPGSPTTVSATRGDPKLLDLDAALSLALRNAEDVLQVYFNIAERARDESVLLAAQELAQRATAELALISAQAQAKS